MSQWGTPKRFGEAGASFVAIPHVTTRNCFDAVMPDMLIDSVHVIERDSIDVDGTSVQSFVGKRYAEWLNANAETIASAVKLLRQTS